VRRGREWAPRLWEHRVIEWWFRNRTTGAITVAQAPNLPLVVFLVAWAVNLVVAPAGSVGTGLDVVAAFALLVWAVEELVRGVNPFRRLLGAAVLGALVAQVV
jgi:hypothetical protein